MRFTTAPEFESDLDAIWNYIVKESRSLQIADRFIDSIQDRIPLIALNPYMGRSRTDLNRQGLRSFPVGDYLIFYRISNQGIRFLALYTVVVI